MVSVLAFLFALTPDFCWVPSREVLDGFFTVFGTSQCQGQHYHKATELVECNLPKDLF